MVKSLIKKFGRRLKKVFNLPVMQVLPGSLAFYFVLSIIPIISLVGLLGSLFSLSVDNFIDFINNSFPPATSNLIIPIIEGKGFDFGVLVFIISAFLLASNGTHTIIVISNMLYNLKNSNYLRTRIKAILLAFMIVFLLGFILIVPVFGDSILTIINNSNIFKQFSDEILLIYRILEIPLSFLFIYFIIKLIYTIAPEKQIKSKDATYGALFTTTSWMIATKIYSYYVSVFAKYDIFYGSIANLIILLIWIYLLSFIFVIGLALNAIRDK
jgi:membrane protein